MSKLLNHICSLLEFRANPNRAPLTKRRCHIHDSMEVHVFANECAPSMSLIVVRCFLGTSRMQVHVSAHTHKPCPKPKPPCKKPISHPSPKPCSKPKPPPCKKPTSHPSPKPCSKPKPPPCKKKSPSHSSKKCPPSPSSHSSHSPSHSDGSRNSPFSGSNGDNPSPSPSGDSEDVYMSTGACFAGTRAKPTATPLPSGALPILSDHGGAVMYKPVAVHYLWVGNWTGRQKGIVKAFTSSRSSKDPAATGE